MPQVVTRPGLLDRVSSGNRTAPSSVARGWNRKWVDLAEMYPFWNRASSAGEQVTDLCQPPLAVPTTALRRRGRSARRWPPVPRTRSGVGDDQASCQPRRQPMNHSASGCVAAYILDVRQEPFWLITSFRSTVSRLPGRRRAGRRLPPGTMAAPTTGQHPRRRPEPVQLRRRRARECGHRVPGHFGPRARRATPPHRSVDDRRVEVGHTGSSSRVVRWMVSFSASLRSRVTDADIVMPPIPSRKRPGH